VKSVDDVYHSVDSNVEQLSAELSVCLNDARIRSIGDGDSFKIDTRFKRQAARIAAYKTVLICESVDVRFLISSDFTSNRVRVITNSEEPFSVALVVELYSSVGVDVTFPLCNELITVVTYEIVVDIDGNVHACN